MSAAQPIRIRPYYSTTVDLDDQPIRVRIMRFTVADLSEYSKLEAAMSERREDRILLIRKAPDELERTVPTETQATEHAALLERVSALEARAGDARDAFVSEVFAFMRSVVTRLAPAEKYRLPDDEVRRRRDHELTAEQRVELEAIRDEEAKASEAFLRFVIERFVRFEPKQVEFEDEDTGDVVPVITGEQILQYFGARTDLLRQLMRAVRNENLMSADEKKDLRSRSASTRSSGERGLAADGLTPDRTAASAGTEGSVSSAVATASTAASPSGETGATSS